MATNTTTSAEQVMHIKLTVLNGKGVVVEMRRFAVPVDTGFEEISQRIQETTQKSMAFRLTYRDNDDDMVVLESEAEWEECQRLGDSYRDPKAPLRLYMKKAKLGGRRCGRTMEDSTEVEGEREEEPCDESPESATPPPGLPEMLESVLGRVPDEGRVRDVLQESIREVTRAVESVVGAAGHHHRSRQQQDRPTFPFLDLMQMVFPQQRSAPEAPPPVVPTSPATPVVVPTVPSEEEEEEDIVVGDEIEAGLVDTGVEREEVESVEEVTLEDGEDEEVEEVVVEDFGAPVPAAEEHEEALKTLQEMGFPLEMSRAALEGTKGDYRAAVNLLLSQ